MWRFSMLGLFFSTNRPMILRYSDRSGNEKREKRSKIARLECVAVLLTVQRKVGTGKVCLLRAACVVVRRSHN